MNTDKEFDLLEQYLHEFIDRRKPVSLDYQIAIYAKRGYIEEGHNGKNYISFTHWKKLNCHAAT